MKALAGHSVGGVMAEESSSPLRVIVDNELPLHPTNY